MDGERGQSFIASIYLPPSGSVYQEHNNEVRRKLVMALSDLESEKNVIIMGDVNGRIGTMGSRIQVGENDFVEVKRGSDDGVVNDEGRELLDLLATFGMVVINGVGEGASTKLHAEG